MNSINKHLLTAALITVITGTLYICFLATKAHNARVSFYLYSVTTQNTKEFSQPEPYTAKVGTETERIRNYFRRQLLFTKKDFK